MTWALESLKNFHINVLLLSKVHIVWAKKVHRNYLSWNWIGVQDLERNRLVVSKLAKGTSQISTRTLESLKNLCFNWLLVNKVYIVWATKVQRSYLSRNWRDMQILKKKLTCGLKKELRNLANCHQSTWKCQNWDFDGILLSKVEKVWP